MFFGLKQFYLTVMSQQYFMSFLTIKQLPDSPPNFLDFVSNESNVIAAEQLSEETLIAIIQNEVNPTAPPATPFPVRAHQHNIIPVIPMMPKLENRIEESTIELQRKVQDQDEWIRHLQSEIQRQS